MKVLLSKILWLQITEITLDFGFGSRAVSARLPAHRDQLYLLPATAIHCRYPLPFLSRCEGESRAHPADVVSLVVSSWSLQQAV